MASDTPQKPANASGAAIDPELLAILVCPETHQPLTLAPADLLARLQKRQTAGTLLNRAGRPQAEPLQAALVRADGTFAYPIIDGIPVMLVEEALPLGQVKE